VSEAGHVSHRKEYFKIFFLLAGLTIVELIIPNMTITKFLKVSSLTLLALGKASVVAWFYMHLKDETKWLRFIALIPISAFLYAAMVILESLYR
jgi:cytochrome c oxidase subunit IV